MAHGTKFYQDGEDVLLLTLDLDASSAEFFEAERRRYFPAELNVVPAHLMLFHKLPGKEVSQIREVLLREAAGCGNMALRITGLRSLGRGVAYQVECGALTQLRVHLAAAFQQWLTAQDKQSYQPHITIQNKVSPEQARQTLTDLKAKFVAFEATGIGLALWRYLGGSWELLDRWPLAKRDGIGHGWAGAPSEEG